MRILVVGDDPAIAQSLQHSLANDPRVSMAVDVAIAPPTEFLIEAVADYAVIVLPATLPEIDGIHRCRQLRAMGFQQAILVLTDPGHPEQPAIALRAGANDYVVQPFRADELTIRIQTLLERSRASRPSDSHPSDQDSTPLPPAPSVAELTALNADLEQALEELKIAEEELQQQNEQLIVAQQNLELERHRYHDLFEHAPDAYVITDLHGGIRQANQAAADLFQARTQYLIGKPLATFIARADCREFRLRLAQLDYDHDWEVTICSKTGQLVPVMISLNPIQHRLDEATGDVTGKVTGLRWLLRDISRRKELEQQLQDSHNALEQRVAARTTELFEINLALQQQQDQWQALFDHALDAIAIWDDGGRFVEANPAACHLLGLSREALLESAIADFVAPELRTSPQWELFLQQGQMLGNFTLHRPDGARREVEATAIANFMPGCHMAILRDVSERVRLEVERNRAETELRQRQEFLSSIYNGAEQGIFVVEVTDTGDFYYSSFNHLGAQLSGQAIETLEGKTPEAAFGETVGARFRQNYSRCLQAGSGIAYEEQIEFATHQVWVLTTLSPLYDEQGTIYRIVGSSLDISDRKQAELRLHQNQETIRQQFAQIEAIYQTAPVGLAVLDRDLRFMRVNQRLADMNGVSVEAHLGRTVRDVLPHLADGVEPLFHYILETGEPLLNFELGGETPAQPGVQGVWLENWFPLKDATGNIVGINVVVQDITRLKQAELALQQQVRQEYLLQEMAQDIRRSLSVDEVLARTVDRVREWLNTDRVIVFRFRPDWQGDVIMESVGPEWTPILSTTIFDPCFGDRYIEPYRQGRISAITDIDTDPLEPCYVELLKTFQVRSNLVVPILQGERLWGLLIAHQCSAPRQWQPAEIAMLRRLSLQVSIAIQQSELYEQTRQELLERERIQTFLEESEERFRALSAAAPIGICQTNVDGLCLYSNRYWQDMSGLNAEDSLGYGWLQAIHPEDQEMFQRGWQTCLQGDSEELPEFRLLTPQGKTLWVSAGVAAMRAASGEITGYVCTQTDITDLKQSEIELRKLGTALSNAVEGISRLDRHGHYVSVNAAYARIVGYTSEAMIGMDWQPTVHPDDLKRVKAAYRHMRKHGSVALEARGIRKDGSVFHKDLFMVADYDDQGILVGHYCFMKDISDKKQLEADRQQAEQALRESEQRLRMILDNSPAAIYLIDAENRFVLANRMCAESLGTQPDELVGLSLYDFWPADIADIFAANNKNVFETGTLLQLEEVVPHSEGDRTYITVKFPLFDGTGVPYAVCGISTDITEQKRMEAQFYRAQRLESLGTLASGISHDLNNVLTPILTMTQLLRMQNHQLGGRSQEMLKIVEDSAKHGAGLVKQILAFARGTGGDRTPIPICAALQNTMGVVQQTFPKTVQIHASIPDAVSWMVSADSTYLHQVFLNLCVNARDAMPDGGHLTVSVDRCFVDAPFAQKNLGAEVGPYVVITIADTGMGIAPEVRDRIFDPFFTTKPPGQGTGLGLATVLGIIKSYGGFLQVFSEVGQGTQIKVYLPEVDATPISPEQSQMQLAHTQLDGNGTLVLLVDDDLAVLHSTRSLLESHHYQVLSTQDGLEAIALYTRHQADIKAVILDIMMPTIGGVELIQRLKTIDPAVKTLAMSGLQSNRELALATGADAFVAKPYVLEDLLEKLHGVACKILTKRAI